MDWEAIRAEYAAGGISQRALARKHGVTVYALKRHALQGCRAPARRAGSDAEIALRTRRKPATEPGFQGDLRYKNIRHPCGCGCGYRARVHEGAAFARNGKCGRDVYAGVGDCV